MKIDPSFKIDSSTEELDLTGKVDLPRHPSEEDILFYRIRNWYKKRGYNVEDKEIEKDIFSDATLEKADYSLIENELMREEFKNLCLDYNHRIGIFYNKDRKRDDRVKMYRWLIFVSKVCEERLGMKYYEKAIYYNSHHYALLEEGEVFIANQFFLRGKGNTIIRWNRDIIYGSEDPQEQSRANKGKYSFAGLVTEYIRLFYWILDGNNAYSFDNLLYHVMKFTEMAMEISEFPIHPRRVYNLCKKEMSTSSKKKPKIPRKVKKNNKKVYVEEGFTKEETFTIDKKDKQKTHIALVFNFLRDKGKKWNVENLKEGLIYFGHGDGLKRLNYLEELVKEMCEEPRWEGSIAPFKSNWRESFDLDKTFAENLPIMKKLFPDKKESVLRATFDREKRKRNKS